MVGVPRTRSAAHLVLAMRPQQAPVSGKVFIQRDYSSGTRCQFQTKFPAELENRVCCLAPRTCPGAREGDLREARGAWAATLAAECRAALGRSRRRGGVGHRCTNRATKQDLVLGGGRIRPSPQVCDFTEL